VLVLSFVQAQGTGDGVDDRRAGAGLLAAFQAGVVVDADPGESGEFLPAQPGRAAQPRAGRQPGLGGGALGTARAQEPTQLAAAALLTTHGLQCASPLTWAVRA
jgi:hypothetical protein